MKQLTFRSIRHEILFFGAIALIVVACTIIGYAGFSQYTLSVQDAFVQVKSLSSDQAILLKDEINQAFEVDRTLAGSLYGTISNGQKPSREGVQAMVYGLMTQYPHYNGIFIVLEPDVWDGKDAAYKGKEGTDETGRFMAYYSRDTAGKPKLDKVYNYSEGEDGSDYYQVPKKTLKEYVTEPFPWDIQGRQILLSSVVVPILIDGKFIGIAGIDLPLENIQGLADAVHDYGNTSKIYLVSYDGIVTGATGYQGSVGKVLGEADIPLSGQAESIITDIQNGRNEVFESKGTIVAYTPVQIGNSDKPWSVILTVPVDVATAQAIMNTFILIIIGAICTCIGLILLFFAAKGIARPIEQITLHADTIAQGELGDEIVIERSDEIGRLADSFRRMLSSLQGKALAADGIAAGDLSVEIPISSDHDLLGISMIIMRDTIKKMAETVTHLAHQATEGNLQIRGDNSLFKGDYQKIVSGINETLDAVIKPVNGTMDLAKIYASGDYTGRFDQTIPVSGSFITLRDAMNQIGKQSASSVSGVKKQIESVVGSIEETTASLEEISASSAKLASSSNEVSSLADTSLDRVNQILSSMDELSVNITHVAEMTDSVASITQKTDELSTKGSMLAQQAEQGMQSITTSIEESNQTMNKMSGQMEQIGQIVKLISDIADQTNLLALNAAIEAARAGDAGRGFSVVADEVKSLAIESQHSAEKITEMITTLQRQSIDASTAMTRSSKDVISGNQAVNETLDLFSEIVTCVNQISEHVSTVATAAQEQAAAVQEITTSVHQLEDQVKQTAEEAVSSAAATEETSAALDQIATSVSVVAQATDTINKEMGRFIV